MHSLADTTWLPIMPLGNRVGLTFAHCPSNACGQEALGCHATHLPTPSSLLPGRSSVSISCCRVGWSAFRWEASQREKKKKSRDLLQRVCLNTWALFESGNCRNILSYYLFMKRQRDVLEEKAFLQESRRPLLSCLCAGLFAVSSCCPPCWGFLMNLCLFCPPLPVLLDSILWK